MDLHTFLIMLHLLGFAFGVGGAISSDLNFIRSTKGRSVKTSEYSTIKNLHHLVTGRRLARECVIPSDDSASTRLARNYGIAVYDV